MCVKVKTKLAKWLWKCESFRKMVFEFYEAEYVTPLVQKLEELSRTKEHVAADVKCVKPKRKYCKKKKDATAKAL